ncbi:hypothetical protein Voc01_091090 [Virgisporangium ochraceum]|uniref:Uncharacterized protein n=1 Tax=Virgisporangium ochraceum TaxID=65505 RepID=A0A8J4A1R5_9ACTN|nr:hypothetical protein Voc01_091090 [Virgisporangium ochraceum]
MSGFARGADRGAPFFRDALLANARAAALAPEPAAPEAGAPEAAALAPGAPEPAAPEAAPPGTAVPEAAPPDPAPPDAEASGAGSGAGGSTSKRSKPNGYAFAALFRSAARSVRSHVNPASSRPK